MSGLRVSEVLRFMGEYTRLTGYPVPAPPGFASEWSRGLELNGEGSGRLLFTGALYQLVPYINATIRFLEVLESRGLSLLLPSVIELANIRPSAVYGLVRPQRGEVEESARILRSIVTLLGRSGVDFAYDPAVSDMYSGALLLDYGVMDGLEDHAKKVVSAINSTGASEVIVVDPHTALTLMEYRVRYGLRPAVKVYLELVKPSKASLNDVVTVHDSCVYSRDLNMWAKVRELLGGAGVSIREARNHGPMTFCCGGPMEALSPRLSSLVARRRLSQLVRASKTIVTACPVCLGNLRRVAQEDVKVVDLSLLLVGQR
ncbi:MAG: heterodisulfide reductase-related iron-sulfur binding cluster [Acidilobus sp.]